MRVGGGDGRGKEDLGDERGGRQTGEEDREGRQVDKGEERKKVEEKI